MVFKEFWDYVMKQYMFIDLINVVFIFMGEVYEEIMDVVYSSMELVEVVNESFRWLNRFEFNDWVLFVFVFFVCKCGELNVMWIFFVNFEWFVYFMLVIKIGTNNCIECFFVLIKEIEVSVDLDVLSFSF